MKTLTLTDSARGAAFLHFSHVFWIAESLSRFLEEMYVNPVNLAAWLFVLLYLQSQVSLASPGFTWLIASYFTSALPAGPEAPPPFI